jgi:hypothetical protein
MNKKHGILGLFLLLVIILVLKPRFILNMYNNILGRVLLIGLVIFFTTCNIALGLLAGLCLIIVSNMFFMEGVNIEGLTNLDNEDITNPMIQPGLTIGDDNVSSNDTVDKINVISKSKSKSKEKEKEKEEGVDRQTLEETVQSKSSESIPVDKSIFESDEVNPCEPTTRVTEGFAPF